MSSSSLIGAFRYVVAAYSEFSLVALLTLYFTNTAAQHVLADSSVTFIVISYSTFLALGFHNGAVRDGAISESEREKNDILRLEIYFSAVVAALLIFSAVVFRNNFYLMAGLLIGGVNHLKTSCQTVFRLLEQDNLLNSMNISWAVMFFVTFSTAALTKIDAELHLMFFGCWILSAFVVVLSFYIYCMIKLKVFKINLGDGRKLFVKILSSSKYMFLMSSGLVVLLTSDRLVLSFLGASDKVRADFQYVDVLTNIYFLGVTAVLYYFTPGMLKMFSETSGASHQDFLSIARKCCTYLAGAFVAFLSMVLLYLVVLGKFSVGLVEVLVSMLLLKTALVVLGFVCNFYLARKLEKLLAFCYLLLMGGGFLVSLLFSSIFLASPVLVFLPFLNFLIVSILVLFLVKNLYVR
ncbi:hypothetical protein ACYZTL_07210 [Pseudomonas sp. LB3P81]